MSYAVLIPARLGSKRVKNKNIRALGGKPLFLWSVETSLSLGIKPYVSSQDKVVLDLAEAGGAIPWKRSTLLSSDRARDQGVIYDLIARTEYDKVIYLRPTTPFRDPKVLMEALTRFHYYQCFQFFPVSGLRSVHEMKESVRKAFEWGLKGRYLKPAIKPWLNTDLPNQAHPVSLQGNGYIDIATRKYNGSWGPRVLGYLTAPVIEIDEEEDFVRAEQYLNSLREGGG